jgi:hypothetical protein
MARRLPGSRAGWLVTLLAAVVVAVGVHWNTRAAGGADSYGYLSEAELWLSGHLRIAQPWVFDAPFDGSASSFAPLGYRPSADWKTIVPTYPAGFPLLLAGAKRLAGQCAMFFVVPLCGSVLVLATYGIGRRLGSTSVGLAAAWLTAASPVFLYMVVQPMSDVPAAAAWTVSVWCVLADTAAFAAAGGAAAAIAVMIRPNLVPMAVAIAGWFALRALADRGDARWASVRRGFLFALAVSPGVIATAALNAYWYGSPLRSGYSALDVLFQWSNILPNLRAYVTSLVTSQTPIAIVGLAAWFVPAAWSWPSRDPRRARVLCAVLIATVWIEYCAYGVFDAWWYLRFLLPVWPLMAIGAVGLVARIVQASRVPVLAATIGCLALGLYTINWASHYGAFRLQRDERKYVVVAAIARMRTDGNSVLFSYQHSGSLRYYGGRMTLNYRGLPPEAFDAVVAWLSGHGAHPFAMLEPWEVDDFRQRFGSASVGGALKMAPVVVYEGTGTIFLYDLVQRADWSVATDHIADVLMPADCQRPAPPPHLVLH